MQAQYSFHCFDLAIRAEFFEYLTNGFYTRVSPDFYNLMGRKPTSYYEVRSERDELRKRVIADTFKRIVRSPQLRCCF